MSSVATKRGSRVGSTIPKEHEDFFRISGPSPNINYSLLINLFGRIWVDMNSELLREAEMSTRPIVQTSKTMRVFCAPNFGRKDANVSFFFFLSKIHRLIITFSTFHIGVSCVTFGYQL